MALEEIKRALIVVRTYPVPTPSGVESSCTAAITDRGEWLRLFPVPWRLLPDDQRFRKYQWVEVGVVKAREDSRRESYRPIPDGIRVLSEPLASWRQKQEFVYPLRAPGLCTLTRVRNEQQYPTLGVFRPARIKKLRIVPLDDPNWTEAQLTMLRQTHLFVTPPRHTLEKIPYSFQYQYHCDEPDCKGHLSMCTDWEMGESYRQWKSKYGDGWQGKFRQRYEKEMIERNDTHFFVGTVTAHPHRWIIIGLFYPPKEQQTGFSFGGGDGLGVG